MVLDLTTCASSLSFATVHRLHLTAGAEENGVDVSETVRRSQLLTVPNHVFHGGAGSNVMDAGVLPVHRLTAAVACVRVVAESSRRRITRGNTIFRPSAAPAFLHRHHGPICPCAFEWTWFGHYVLTKMYAKEPASFADPKIIIPPSVSSPSCPLSGGWGM